MEGEVQETSCIEEAMLNIYYKKGRIVLHFSAFVFLFCFVLFFATTLKPLEESERRK